MNPTFELLYPQLAKSKCPLICVRQNRPATEQSSLYYCSGPETRVHGNYLGHVKELATSRNVIFNAISCFTCFCHITSSCCVAYLACAQGDTIHSPPNSSIKLDGEFYNCDSLQLPLQNRPHLSYWNLEHMLGAKICLSLCACVYVCACVCVCVHTRETTKAAVWHKQQLLWEPFSL